MGNITPCITITKYILRDPSVLTTSSMSVDYIDQYTIENTNTIDTVQAIARVTGLNVVQSGPTGQQTSVVHERYELQSHNGCHQRCGHQRPQYNRWTTRHRC